MSMYWFIHGDEYTTSIQSINNRGNWVGDRGCMINFFIICLVFGKPKTSLKLKSINSSKEYETVNIALE